MGEIVEEVGGMVGTVSPAFNLNEQFKRQVDRVRDLRGGSTGSDEKKG